MSRESKPWFWQKRKGWYCTIRGERISLGSDREEAFLEFHRRMAAAPDVAEPTGDQQLIVTLIDKFLSFVETNLAWDTYEWYRSRLQCWCNKYPDLTVGELKKHHVQEWIDEIPGKAGTKRNYARAIQRCMSWCDEMDHIDFSPIAKFRKPAGGKRERIVKPEEYRKILSLAGSAEFRDLITIAWECGCRPQEVLAVEARHVDLIGCRWFFPKSEAPKGKHDRAIYLNDKAMEITTRLVARHPEGKLFRNSAGDAWTTDAVNCAFIRVQTRMGREKLGTVKTQKKRVPPAQRQAHQAAVLTQRKERNALARSKSEKFCLYNMRHSWINRLLTVGVDSLTVAVLAGHVDPSTLATTYQHLTQDTAFLLTESRRA